LKLLFYSLHSKSATMMRWCFWCPEKHSFGIDHTAKDAWRQNSSGFWSSFARCQANAVEIATWVCFLLFNSSCTMRKLCNVCLQVWQVLPWTILYHP